MLAHIDSLDPLIHQPARLRLLALLAKQQEAVCFQALTERFHLHPSTLSMQLKLLEQARFIEIKNRAKGRSALTRVVITPTGREAFARYSEHLLAALQIMTEQESCEDG